ncbi:MAG: methylenetetrahydrofolate reductase [NAD(P)H] [Zetaproteobacteria bacterium]|nr:MAG: methylenetetrahydrofolate reductase [NAD(P)H] [Zetaproteobacteria bacterium]
MRLDALYAERRTPTISFEFFPPKTEQGEEKLWATLEALSRYQPDFVSVTYGAGGSERARTRNIVVRIAQTTDLTPVAHLTCVAEDETQIRALLDDYAAHGVENILALRGDPPQDPAFRWPENFRYATDLIRFIRAHDHFAIACATYPEGHPESPNGPEDDARVLKMKQDLGACVAITQYFFDNDDYFRFRDMAARFGVAIPIVPGIMPIRNFEQIVRFSERCGATIPDWLRERFAEVGDDQDAARKLAIEIAVRQCEALLAGGAPGLHFYTLNQPDLTSAILNTLGFSRP